MELVEKDVDLEPCLLEGKDANGQLYWIFFAFNHTKQTLQPRFGIELPGEDFAASDIITRQTVPGQFKDGRWVVEKTLAPWEIWVIKILKGELER